MTTVPVVPPSSVAPQSSGGSADIFISGAVIAAVLGAVINIALARYKDRSEERERLRKTFAEAFEAAVQYKEFPYAIRRRRADQPAVERVRISEEMRKVQSRLSYYEVWTEGESKEVGEAYKNLVTNLRRVAGKACNEAWKVQPIQNDSEMNLPSGVIDLSELREHEKAYVAAVHRHFRPFFHR